MLSKGKKRRKFLISSVNHTRELLQPGSCSWSVYIRALSVSWRVLCWYLVGSTTRISILQLSAVVSHQSKLRWVKQIGFCVFWISSRLIGPSMWDRCGRVSESCCRLPARQLQIKLSWLVFQVLPLGVQIHKHYFDYSLTIMVYLLIRGRHNGQWCRHRKRII